MQLTPDRLVASAISLCAYGHEVTSEDDKLINQMEEVAGISSTVGTPGQTPVDFFPFRKFTRPLAEERLIMSLSSIRADLASWGWVPQEIGRREDTHK